MNNVDFFFDQNIFWIPKWIKKICAKKILQSFSTWNKAKNTNEIFIEFLLIFLFNFYWILKDVITTSCGLILFVLIPFEGCHNHCFWINPFWWIIGSESKLAGLLCVPIFDRIFSWRFVWNEIRLRCRIFGQKTSTLDERDGRFAINVHDLCRTCIFFSNMAKIGDDWQSYINSDGLYVFVS